MGRLVADGASIDNNVFINAAELSIAGRPLTNERVVLPRQRDLVLPESTDASADLRTAERQRPSPEQVRAQKGRQRLQTVMSSLLNVSEYNFGNKPVCIVNFTPYVEDLGLCVLDLKMGPPSASGFDFRNKLHYIGVHWMDKSEFGRMRVVREVLEAWMDGKLKISGFEFQSVPPSVPQDQISLIPGADVAMGSVDRLEMEVLVRDGGSVVIKPDEIRYWRSIRDEFCLAGVINLGGGTATAVNPVQDQEDGAGQGNNTPAPEVFESLEKLKEADPIEESVASEVSHVTMMRSKSGSLYLMLEADPADSGAREKILPRKMQLGGYGSGTYSKVEDANPGVYFTMGRGDATVCQFDESSLKPESTNIEAWSLYKMVTQVEKHKRLAKVNVSFLKLTRKQDDAALDGFEVEMTAKMKYQPITAQRDLQKAVTCKNFFKWFAGDKVKAIDESPYIMTVFRFRYEGVGTNLKVQKPYVLTKTGIKLELQKPVKARLTLPCPTPAASSSVAPEHAPEKSPRAFSEAGEESETPRPKAHAGPKRKAMGRGRGRGGRGRGRAKKTEEEAIVTEMVMEGDGEENGEPDELEVPEPEVPEPKAPEPEGGLENEDGKVETELKPKKKKVAAMKKPSASRKAASECRDGEVGSPTKKPASLEETGKEAKNAEIGVGDKKTKQSFEVEAARCEPWDYPEGQGQAHEGGDQKGGIPRLLSAQQRISALKKRVQALNKRSEHAAAAVATAVDCPEEQKAAGELVGFEI
eukprot:s4234_g3.t1